MTFEIKAKNNFPKSFAFLLVFSSILCGLYVLNSTYGQWSRPDWGGALNSHDLISSMLFYVAWIVGFISIPVIVVRLCSGLVNKKPLGMRLIFLLLLSIFCAASALPSERQYAAFTVLIFGPGNHAVRLQQSAARWDSVVLLKVLVFRGVSLEGNLLVVAAGFNSPRVIPYLILNGFDVNAKVSSSQTTALHAAVKHRQYENAKQLLQFGAKTDVLDKVGTSPIESASNMSDQRMLDILHIRN